MLVDSGPVETNTLDITGLRAGYGPLEIIRGLNLRVEPGEFVALMGPNGAGKSTLLKTLIYSQSSTRARSSPTPAASRTCRT